MLKYIEKNHAAFAGDPVLLQAAYVSGTLYDSCSMLFPLHNFGFGYKTLVHDLTSFSTSSPVDRSISLVNARLLCFV